MAKTRTSADAREHMRDVVRVERRANLARENQAVVLPRLTDSHTVLSLTGPMTAKQLHNLRRQEERPS
jgi:hypothetical protein